MMFGGLSEKLQTAVSKMSGQSSLTEENIKDALRDVRLALLEADVNFLLVKEVVEQIRQKAVGVALEKGVQPAQKLFSLVHEQLVELLGGEQATPFQLSSGRQHKILMVGLQGSGKTTTAGKLARYFKDLKPTLVAADIYRPAAISQLATVAKQAGADFYQAGQKDPVEIAREGLAKAKESNSRLVILDTAGRLQIDEDLMNELIRVKAAFEPDHILMVLDSMTGQEAIKVAQAFDEKLNITGVILSKADGDARGGAALSVSKVTKKPVLFLGIGEKLDGLELFSAQRVASRILGMGDVVGLVEKASEVMDESTAKKMQRKMGSGEFNLEDFLEQMQMIKKMGPMGDLLKMIPGVGQMIGEEQLGGVEQEMKRTVAIISSMTPHERQDPSILNGSRKRRVAQGSGTNAQQINHLLRQFEQMKQAMKQMKKAGFFKPANLLKGKLPFGM